MSHTRLLVHGSHQLRFPERCPQAPHSQAPLEAPSPEFGSSRLWAASDLCYFSISSFPGLCLLRIALLLSLSWDSDCDAAQFQKTPVVCFARSRLACDGVFVSLYC